MGLFVPELWQSSCCVVVVSVSTTVVGWLRGLWVGVAVAFVSCVSKCVCTCMCVVCVDGYRPHFPHSCLPLT